MLFIFLILTSIISQIITIEEEPVLDPRCPTVDDPHYTVHLPHETYCEYFYKCANGYRVLIPCPPGTHWSVEHDRCEWPELANCDPAMLPPIPEFTTTQRPNNCPDVDNPNVLVFVGDKNNCENYFLCFNGNKIQRKCSDGLKWNQNRNWCDFPQNVEC
ncbi:hypothetical protein PVAND_017352 [Polypedilum vanderplanki]|uniref:Chitin-binding type-2 domain-containing protein n=1 Tax=Polypedilum vanderplanki TaxID=319348 RepID=A0A9J6BHU4_POLVA|nr:hypothetical protein PVAND_017352 [Polypedilum vanderplanki]